MEIIKNFILERKSKRNILLDCFYEATGIAKPVVIFIHGFKGFKDWGAWDLVAKCFAEKGFVFVKFNFSLNGTTIENPAEFDNLEAFGQNTFSQELQDLEDVINWTFQKQDAIPDDEINRKDISLIGHSRGGGIALVKTSEDTRIKKLITWAAVSDFGVNWDDQFVEEWQEKGVTYVMNGRTKQEMPLNFSLYQDYHGNGKLNIVESSKNITIPSLIIHGTDDMAVNYESALHINKSIRNSGLILIENANHVFGASHPYSDDQLPDDMKMVIAKSCEFLKTS